MNQNCVNAVVSVMRLQYVSNTFAGSVVLEQLQANQTVLFRLWLYSIGSCNLSWEKALYGWSWGRVSGAAAGWFAELVGRMIDKAVGSRLTGVLNTDGQLHRTQGPVNTINVQTEQVGVCGAETQKHDITLRIISHNKIQYQPRGETPSLCLRVERVSFHFI